MQKNINHEKPVIFIGENCRDFKISTLTRAMRGRVEVSRFVNGESRIRLLQPVKTKNCIILQSTTPAVNDCLFELCLLTDTLRRNGAKSISLWLPYLSYGRQHQAFRQRESQTMNMVLSTLKHVGADSVQTIEAHSPDIVANSPLPITNKSAMPVFAEVLANKFIVDEIVVVAPDTGGRSRAEKFAKLFFKDRKNMIAYANKIRDKHQTHSVRVTDIEGRVRGKTALIIDDICTTGNTLIQAVKKLKHHGAHNVVAAIVHADMTQDIFKALQASDIQKIFISNTIKHTLNTKKLNKFEVIDVSELFPI